MSVDVIPTPPQVVAIGGGHGLGRVLASMSHLEDALTGIVATTDNGGSTGRLRQNHHCIAWGDLRNCLSQLASQPSVGSLLFEYRFKGDDEISGHNLGNLMLHALDQLCIRPLEAVNLIRNMLNIKSKLIPMSEQPTHLLALDHQQRQVFGELNIDGMNTPPANLMLEPQVNATCEAVMAIAQADLVILGPGSFFTSIMPPLLLPSIAKAIASTQADIVFIDNIADEQSSASQLSFEDKIKYCERFIGHGRINYYLKHGEKMQTGRLIQAPLDSRNQPGRHERQVLQQYLERILTKHYQQPPTEAA
ncbi:uridine diphosphate-N-acetylglucosamine-binding protein YvcK [Shewanella sp. NIFS-20-20]|uniref:uridine diphosphate-N-acetylglucosamine-binding protein YvcK n=1 Tax=Shewanella sp. NIFS-20-20 TaxID=2853806 RepID=UPI001C480B1A|nr:uridine diphosphate-N-acetylglucosamine-binding protein YvcK [Shewanella sp. NIFS-20-20]MBV7315703.1 uridine diphosphate-N-acetylglucosamine-binding protein YvcK [Shewanella sp. NIFS-20-20]